MVSGKITQPELSKASVQLPPGPVTVMVAPGTGTLLQPTLQNRRPHTPEQHIWNVVDPWQSIVADGGLNQQSDLLGVTVTGPGSQPRFNVQHPVESVTHDPLVDVPENVIVTPSFVSPAQMATQPVTRQQR